MDEPLPTKVLITGANGLIGNLVYAHLAAQPAAYAAYGLVRERRASQRAAASGAFVDIAADQLRLADLGDFGAVQRAVAGMQVVVHLAAEAHLL